MVYVNGEFRGAWGEKDPECFKFQWQKTKSLANPKHLKAMVESKLFSKKEIQEYKDKHFKYYSPIYRSFATLKKTLLANNKDIELVISEQ